MDHCDECGFDYASAGVSVLPGRLRGFQASYAAVLDAAVDVRRRPAPDVWSPLEYSCHVRDVFRVQRDRLALALRIAQPAFTSMGRDARVVDDAYNEQVPTVVVKELGAAAEELADALVSLRPDELARTGVYPYPAPEPRSLLWVGRHSVHEGEHHLRDIRRMG